MPDMIADIHPMLGVVGLEKARYELNSTILPTEVARYIVAAGRRTRELPGVQLGASSRSLIHLASASKAIARLAGRDTVEVEDVREIAPYVLRHRLIVDPRRRRGRRAAGGARQRVAPSQAHVRPRSV